jgi:hypothetical protein
MGESYSKTQLPPPRMPAPEQGVEAAFQRGLALGRDYAGIAVRRIGAWAEENPGQILLAGLAAGFILGKLLLPSRRKVIEDPD